MQSVYMSHRRVVFIVCTYINILFSRSSRFSFRLFFFIYLMLRTHSYFWFCWWGCFHNFSSSHKIGVAVFSLAMGLRRVKAAADVIRLADGDWRPPLVNWSVVAVFSFHTTHSKSLMRDSSSFVWYFVILIVSSQSLLLGASIFQYLFTYDMVSYTIYIIRYQYTNCSSTSNIHLSLIYLLHCRTSYE